MRPPSPPLFRRGVLAGARLAAKIEQLTRMILRQAMRWPVLSLTTCAGIAMAVAVLIMALQWLDAVEHMVYVYFRQAQSQDVTISFVEPRSNEVLLLCAVDADRAVLRTVQIDRRNSTHAQVVAGIDVGERIVLHPNDRLSPGVHIVTRADAER